MDTVDTLDTVGIVCCKEPLVRGMWSSDVMARPIGQSVFIGGGRVLLHVADHTDFSECTIVEAAVGTDPVMRVRVLAHCARHLVLAVVHLIEVRMDQIGQNGTNQKSED